MNVKTIGTAKFIAYAYQKHVADNSTYSCCKAETNGDMCNKSPQIKEQLEDSTTQSH